MRVNYSTRSGICGHFYRFIVNDSNCSKSDVYPQSTQPLPCRISTCSEYRRNVEERLPRLGSPSSYPDFKPFIACEHSWLIPSFFRRSLPIIFPLPVTCAQNCHPLRIDNAHYLEGKMYIGQYDDELTSPVRRYADLMCVC